ncbi:hypothetical protein HDV01_002204 [Terramyces sp. JEL0728]|nr:hypothetical protein HDV01_002204 [Terramyces sp. JEL0728]
MDYKIFIRQEPKMCRCCETKELDFIDSCIDPMLILEIRFLQDQTEQQLKSKQFICNISLLTVDHKPAGAIVEDPDIVGNENTYLHNLIGERTVSATILNDPNDGKAKLFFVFNCLGIREKGFYRFKCHVVDIESNHVTELTTTSFRVYTLRSFKPNRTRTILQVAFERQGVFNKNGKEYRRRLTEEDTLLEWYHQSIGEE